MARTSISRTIVETYCEVRYIDQNNAEQRAEVKLFGDYDITKAQRPAIKALNAKGGVVLKVRHKSYYASMSLEEFAKHSVKTNYKEW